MKDLSISRKFWMVLMDADFRTTAIDLGDGHLRTTCGLMDTGIDKTDKPMCLMLLYTVIP